MNIVYVEGIRLSESKKELRSCEVEYQQEVPGMEDVYVERVIVYDILMECGSMLGCVKLWEVAEEQEISLEIKRGGVWEPLSVEFVRSRVEDTRKLFHLMTLVTVDVKETLTGVLEGVEKRDGELQVTSERGLWNVIAQSARLSFLNGVSVVDLRSLNSEVTFEMLFCIGCRCKVREGQIALSNVTREYEKYDSYEGNIIGFGLYDTMEVELYSETNEFVGELEFDLREDEEVLLSDSIAVYVRLSRKEEEDK